MGLAARLAASTPIVVQPTAAPPPSSNAQPAAAPASSGSSPPAMQPAAMLPSPPSYDQSTTQDPFQDANRSSFQPPLGDQKASPAQQSPVPGSSSAFASSSSQPQRQNSIVSVAPSTVSSGSGSVKRKSSIFKNPFRRNSTQDAGSSSSSSSQQQRPLSTVYANQPQSFAPPPGAPPAAALQPNRQSVIDRSINKTGEFHLSEEQVLHILEYTVQDQGIGAFYDRRSLQRIAGEVSRSSALNSLAVSWGLPREIAADLVKLALFDCVILVDDSGSMAFEEEGSRIDDMKLIVERVALAASLFDDDGISVRFLNSNIEGNGIRDSQGAMDLISRVRFSGLTPLGTAMEQKIIDPLIVRPAKAGRLPKPVLVIAVTDGTPQGEPRDKILRVIMQANKELSRTRYGADALSISFAQVGNDQRAQAFLGEIDVHPQVGGLVDCTSNYELEADEMMRNSQVELTPAVWIMKVLMGGIDSSYDAADE